MYARVANTSTAEHVCTRCALHVENQDEEVEAGKQLWQRPRGVQESDGIGQLIKVLSCLTFAERERGEEQDVPNDHCNENTKRIHKNMDADSLLAKRRRAEAWLSKRRQIVMTWRQYQELACKKGIVLPPLIFPDYPGNLEVKWPLVLDCLGDMYLYVFLCDLLY